MQVASPSRERVEQYQALRDEVEVTVGRINGEFARSAAPPVHYLHQTYPLEEMVALYLAADVMLVTPLRDGMNLVAKEYVACRSDENGALVLSEFTGAADELGSGLPRQPARHRGAEGRHRPGHQRLAGRAPAADAGHAPPGQGVRHPALGRQLPDRAEPRHHEPADG